MDKIWISSAISNWSVQSQGGKYWGNEWERAYHIWEHSRNLVNDSSNEFNLADGVANLKRALNHRLKLLEEIYAFKKIEISNKPNGYLELLERYNIVRPFIMKTLLSIRNDIEHNDASPPDIERCKELVDIVWYFLKSTDSITQAQAEDPLFKLLDKNGFETHYFYTADIDFKDTTKIKIYGWFPNNIIYTVAQEDTSKVIIQTMKTNMEGLNEIEKREGEIDPDLLEEYKGRSDTDIWICGELLPTPDVRLAMIKKQLTCY